VTAHRVPGQQQPSTYVLLETNYVVHARSILVWRPEDSAADKTEFRQKVLEAQARVTSLFGVDVLPVADIKWDQPVETTVTPGQQIGFVKDANGFITLNAAAIAAQQGLTPANRVNALFSSLVPSHPPDPSEAVVLRPRYPAWQANV